MVAVTYLGGAFCSSVAMGLICNDFKRTNDTAILNLGLYLHILNCKKFCSCSSEVSCIIWESISEEPQPLKDTKLAVVKKEL